MSSPATTKETILETRICRLTGKEFDITDRDAAFYEKVSPVFAGKKYLIPFPTLCPESRHQRRLAFGNQRCLYTATCALCHASMVSRFHENAGYTVYCNTCWSEWAWDPLAYGSEFDFSRTFFSQLSDLIRSTPYQNLIGSHSNVLNNATYTNHTSDIANSYFVFDATGGVENCLHSTYIVSGESLVDCLHCTQSSRLYECINTDRSHNSFYLRDCTDCRDSLFLKNCSGCSDCIGCNQLENQSYCIFNQRFSREEFFEKKKALWSLRGIHSEIEKTFPEWKSLSPRDSGNMWSENVDGYRIKNSKDVHASSDILNCENIRFSQSLEGAHDCSDVSAYGQESQRMYESFSVGRYSSDILFSAIVWKGRHLSYCIEVKKSEHCFGCVNMEEKSYSILNKQYTKDEYEVLVPKIIDKMISDWEWWEFFPSSLSPFGYNESVAMEYFPLSRDEALSTVIPAKAGMSSPEISSRTTSPKKEENWSSIPACAGMTSGSVFNWSGYEPPFPSVEKVIPGEKLPDTIQDVPDDVLNWAIKCEVSWKLFKIVQPELEFYRKHSLPVPRKHPDVRHGERVAWRKQNSL